MFLSFLILNLLTTYSVNIYASSSKSEEDFEPWSYYIVCSSEDEEEETEKKHAKYFVFYVLDSSNLFDIFFNCDEIKSDSREQYWNEVGVNIDKVAEVFTDKYYGYILKKDLFSKDNRDIFWRIFKDIIEYLKPYGVTTNSFIYFINNGYFDEVVSKNLSKLRM